MRVACAEGMDQPANRDTPGVWNRYPPAPSPAVEVRNYWINLAILSCTKCHMYNRDLRRDANVIPFIRRERRNVYVPFFSFARNIDLPKSRRVNI